MVIQMAYSGRFKPSNPQKYKGDPTQIVYRSLWERKFMVYCDKNDAVIQWQSEEIAIPYKSPVDGKWHRYFPDFMIKYKDATGKIRRVMVEVKPAKQCKQPDINPPKKTKTWLNEVYTWGTNQAKWEAAKEYCKDRLWEFKIFTEKELGIK